MFIAYDAEQQYLRDEAHQSQGKGPLLALPFSYQEKEIHGTQNVLFLAMQQTMYMPTFSLAADSLVFSSEKDHPDWGFVVAERVSSWGGDTQWRCHRKTADGWVSEEQKDPESLIEELDPSVIAFSTSSRDLAYFAETLRELDTEHRLVVGGGSGIDACPAEVLRRYRFNIDAFFQAGNAAEHFSRLLEDPSQWHQIPGVLGMKSYFDTGGPERTISVGYAENQQEAETSLPVIVPAEHQRITKWGDKWVYRFQSARGCKYSCTFCSLAKNFQTHTEEEIRSFLDSVVSDIKRRDLDPSKVLIYLEDGNVGGDPSLPETREMLKNATKLLNVFKDYPSLRFGIQVRYDNLSGSYINLLHQGNVKYIFTSVESTDPKVLRGMGKGQPGSLEDIYRTFKLLKSHDIDYTISCIRGTSGDTLQTFSDTLKFIKLLAPELICCEIAKAYPGTHDSLRLKKTGLDVARRYMTGEGLCQNPELGFENMGNLLLIPEKDAAEALKMGSEILCSQEELDFSEKGFRSLQGDVSYEMAHPGFFIRKC